MTVYFIGTAWFVILLRTNYVIHRYSVKKFNNTLINTKYDYTVEYNHYKIMIIWKELSQLE